MGEKEKRADRPPHFEQAVRRIKNKIEAPLLSPAQAALWHSDYLEGADEALALLEKAGQDKNTVVPGIEPG